MVVFFLNSHCTKISTSFENFSSKVTRKFVATHEKFPLVDKTGPVIVKVPTTVKSIVLGGATDWL